MPRPSRIHNMHHNASERTPGRLMFWDTETLPEGTGAGEIHHLRLWAAQMVERRGPTRKRGRPLRWDGTTVAQVVDAVESAVKSGEVLWIVAHNLGFDLAVTGLPLAMCERGWEISQHALSSPSPWLIMRRGKRSVTMVDSGSWLPVPLERLGEAEGIDKPPLPAWEDSDAVWLERCWADVEILAAAYCRLLDWWDRERLGHWSRTGPTTGFNSYRHMKPPTTVTFDPDPELKRLERGVIYGGRGEVWRLGQQPPGTYALVDGIHAFGSVLSELRLPRKHARSFDALPLDHRATFSEGLDCIAQVEVETTSPRYPLRTRRGVVHPVGRFCTTLCGPEIRDAIVRDELRAIGPGVMYWMAPHMRTWGRWALRHLDDPEIDCPEVARVAVKAWTRTVPGKWAGRTSRVSHVFEQPVPGWRLERGVNWPGGASFAILDMAGTRSWITQDVEADNGFPAVLAWIQSHVRVRLSRMIDLIGEDAVVLCNTDGLVVDVDAFCRAHDPYAFRFLGQQGRLDLLGARLEAWSQVTWPLRWGVKWVSRSLEVLSPQHVITDRQRQLSGVPRSADHLGGHRYAFTDWPKLATQLEGGWEGGYRRRDRTVDLSGIPTLRWVLEDGRCRAVAASGRLGEPTALQPWPVGQNGAAEAALRAVQHPLLEPLR